MIYEKYIVKPKTINPESTSILQVLQICQVCLNNPNNISHIFIDGYYTRYILAEVIKSITDNQCKITRIVKINLVDSTNKPNLKKVI